MVAIAVYCGSFAGMGGVFTAKELLITSLITTILIHITRNFFKGFGGKLGITAFVASILTQIIVVIFGNGADKFNDIVKLIVGLFTSFHLITDTVAIICVVLSSILGFCITVFMHHTLKHTAVFSSAFPSFIVGLLTLSSFSEVYTSLIAVSFFSSSFVGMVAEGLLPVKHYPILIVVHALAILIFKGNLGEYGGALGTMAFFSVLLIIQTDFVLGVLLGKIKLKKRQIKS